MGFVFIFLQNKYVIIDNLLCNSNVQSAVVFFLFFLFIQIPTKLSNNHRETYEERREERGERIGETYEDGGSRGSIHLPPLALSLVQRSKAQ